MLQRRTTDGTFERLMEQQRKVSAKPVVWNGAKWQTKRYATARAYIYDYRADSFKNISKDGKLHQGVVNTGGAVLDASQVEKLQDIFEREPDRLIMSRCYSPHHAFIFCDAQDNIVANLSICFGCGTYSSSNESNSRTSLSFRKAVILIKELGLPMSVKPPFGNKAWDSRYREVERLAEIEARQGSPLLRALSNASLKGLPLTGKLSKTARSR